MPARSAAAITTSPGWASIARPSTVTVRVSLAVCSVCDISTAASCAVRALPVFDVDEELVAEHADGRDDRRGDGRAEDADRCLPRRPGQTRGDVVADVEEEVEVLFPSGAALDSVHDLVDPAGALSAGGALATRLVVEETGDAPRGPHRARGVVHHDDGPGAEHGPRLPDLVLVEGHVDLVGPEPRGRGAAGDERLQLPVVDDAAAQPRVVEEIAELGLRHLDLVVARPVDAARQREDARARRPALAHRRERRPAVERDPREIGDRLDVVDDGGRPVETDGGREERRLDAGEAPLALETLDYRRLLAADVGAGARVDDE